MIYHFGMLVEPLNKLAVTHMKLLKSELSKGTRLSQKDNATAEKL
jgi:hypothetical protein